MHHLLLVLGLLLAAAEIKAFPRSKRDDASCKNTYDQCPAWRGLGWCTDSQYKDYMATVCPVTCEFCKEGDGGEKVHKSEEGLEERQQNDTYAKLQKQSEEQTAAYYSSSQEQQGNSLATAALYNGYPLASDVVLPPAVVDGSPLAPMVAVGGSVSALGVPAPGMPYVAPQSSFQVNTIGPLVQFPFLPNPYNQQNDSLSSLEDSLGASQNSEGSSSKQSAGHRKQSAADKGEADGTATNELEQSASKHLDKALAVAKLEKLVRFGKAGRKSKSTAGRNANRKYDKYKSSLLKAHKKVDHEQRYRSKSRVRTSNLFNAKNDTATDSDRDPIHWRAADSHSPLKSKTNRSKQNFVSPVQHRKQPTAHDDPVMNDDGSSLQYDEEGSGEGSEGHLDDALVADAQGLGLFTGLNFDPNKDNNNEFSNLKDSKLPERVAYYNRTLEKTANERSIPIKARRNVPHRAQRALPKFSVEDAKRDQLLTSALRLEPQIQKARDEFPPISEIMPEQMPAQQSYSNLVNSSPDDASVDAPYSNRLIKVNEENSFLSSAGLSIARRDAIESAEKQSEQAGAALSSEPESDTGSGVESGQSDDESSLEDTGKTLLDKLRRKGVLKAMAVSHTKKKAAKLTGSSSTKQAYIEESNEEFIRQGQRNSIVDRLESKRRLKNVSHSHLHNETEKAPQTSQVSKYMNDEPDTEEDDDDNVDSKKNSSSTAEDDYEPPDDETMAMTGDASQSEEKKAKAMAEKLMPSALHPNLKKAENDQDEEEESEDASDDEDKPKTAPKKIEVKKGASRKVLMSVVLRQNYDRDYEKKDSPKFQMLSGNVKKDIEKALSGCTVTDFKFAEATIEGNPRQKGKTKVTFAFEGDASKLKEIIESGNVNGLSVVKNSLEEEAED